MQFAPTSTYISINYDYCQQKAKKRNQFVFHKTKTHSHAHSEIRGHPPSLMKVNIVFIGQNADKFVSIVGLADF